MEQADVKTTEELLLGEPNNHLIQLFSLNCDNLISAARANNTLFNLIKERLIEGDRERGNDRVVSRDQWREERWGERVEEAFLEQKKLLDRISFWYWIAPNKPIAMEYYYQLCNKEISFADIKQQFPEATYHNNKKLKLLSDNLRSMAQRSSVNIPVKPINNGKNKFLIFMLTNRQPAKLDDALRHKLLVDLEQQWCEREIKRLLDDASDMSMQINEIPHQQSA